MSTQNQRVSVSPNAGSCTYSVEVKTPKGSTVVVSSPQMFEVIAGISNLYSLAVASECKCGSHDITLTQKQMDGANGSFLSYAMKCNKCNALLQLNQDKADVDVFHVNRTGEYVGWIGGQQPAAPQQRQPQNSQSQQPRQEQPRQQYSNQRQYPQDNRGQYQSNQQQRQPRQVQNQQSGPQYQERQPSVQPQPQYAQPDIGGDEDISQFTPF